MSQAVAIATLECSYYVPTSPSASAGCDCDLKFEECPAAALVKGERLESVHNCTTNDFDHLEIQRPVCKNTPDLVSDLTVFSQKTAKNPETAFVSATLDHRAEVPHQRPGTVISQKGSSRKDTK
jgi:hypothetical protein